MLAVERQRVVKVNSHVVPGILSRAVTGATEEAAVEKETVSAIMASAGNSAVGSTECSYSSNSTRSN